MRNSNLENKGFTNTQTSRMISLDFYSMYVGFNITLLFCSKLLGSENWSLIISTLVDIPIKIFWVQMLFYFTGPVPWNVFTTNVAHSFACLLTHLHISKSSSYFKVDLKYYLYPKTYKLLIRTDLPYRICFLFPTVSQNIAKTLSYPTCVMCICSVKILLIISFFKTQPLILLYIYS